MRKIKVKIRERKKNVFFIYYFFIKKIKINFLKKIKKKNFYIFLTFFKKKINMYILFKKKLILNLQNYYFLKKIKKLKLNRDFYNIFYNLLLNILLFLKIGRISLIINNISFLNYVVFNDLKFDYLYFKNKNNYSKVRLKKKKNIKKNIKKKIIKNLNY